MGFGNCQIYPAGAETHSSQDTDLPPLIEPEVQEQELGRLLIIAAETDDIDTVKKLIQECNVNVQNVNGNTALIAAANFGHETIAKLLLQVPEIDVNTQNKKGSTALMCAVCKGHENIVKLLLQVPNIDINAKNKDGYTALMQAIGNAQESIAELLLQMPKIEINAEDANGNTALAIATIKGQENMVKLILQAPGIAINKPAKDGFTPLMAAVDNKHENIVKLLLDCPGIDVNLQEQQGCTALLWAVDKGLENSVKILLEHNADVNIPNKDGDTPLLLAVNHGHENIVKMLLQRPKININIRDNEGFTPLDIASQPGKENIYKHLLQSPEIDVNIKSKGGWTQLITAAGKGDVERVKQLLQSPKIDVNAQIDEGHTALMYAVHEKHIDVVKLLLQVPGIDINIQAKNRMTAYSAALEQGDPNILELFLKHPDFINKCNKNGVTPLILACQQKNSDRVSVLLRSPEIDVNAQTTACDDPKMVGATALIWAAHGGRNSAVKCLLDDPRVNINAKTKDGYTALEIAKQQRELAMELPKKGNSQIVISGHIEDHYLATVELIQNKITKLTNAAFRAISDNLDKLKSIVNRIGIDGIVDLDDNTLLDCACAAGKKDIIEYLLHNAQDPQELLSRFPFESINPTSDIFKLCMAIAYVTEPKLTAGSDMQASSTASPTTQISQQELLDKWFEAATTGNLATMQSLVNKIDINARNKSGFPALVLAVSRWHENIVKFLLKQPGIDVNTNNNDRLKLFLKSGNADIEEGWAILSRESDTWPPIAIAAHNGHENILKALLKVPGINVNATNLKGSTALSFATQQGFENIIEILLQAPGINVNVQNSNRVNVLMLACAKGYEHIVKLLLQAPGIDINARDIMGNTALIHAIFSNYDSHRTLELGAIAKEGHENIVKMLLETPGINIRDKAGKTVLEVALKNDLVRTKRANIIKLLQDKIKGISPDQQTINTDLAKDTKDRTEQVQKSCANCSSDFAKASTDGIPDKLEQISKVKLCAFCSKADAAKRCSKCKKVFYCSAECQKADWKDHKTQCGKEF